METHLFAIIGPFVIEDNLISDLYLSVLARTLDSLISHELETQINAEGNIALQEDLLHF